MEMHKQMTEKDRVRIEDLFQNHPAGKAMVERFAAKAAAKTTTEVKLETARAALKKGFSINDVADITGLSKEIVTELNKELEN